MRPLIFTLVFAGFYGIVPVAFAIDPNALVTCDGTAYAGGVACDFCKFVVMVEKVAKFIVSILIIISVIIPA